MLSLVGFTRTLTCVDTTHTPAFSHLHSIRVSHRASHHGRHHVVHITHHESRHTPPPLLSSTLHTHTHTTKIQPSPLEKRYTRPPRPPPPPQTQAAVAVAAAVGALTPGVENSFIQLLLRPLDRWTRPIINGIRAAGRCGSASDSAKRRRERTAVGGVVFGSWIVRERTVSLVELCG